MAEERDDRPVIRAFQCYVMWCVGELPTPARQEMEAATPVLNKRFRMKGSWPENISTLLGLTAKDRKRILQQRKGDPDEPIEEFAAGIVDIELMAWRICDRKAWGRRKWTVDDLFEGSLVFPRRWNDYRDLPTLLRWLQSDDAEQWKHAAYCVSYAHREGKYLRLQNDEFIEWLWRRFRQSGPDFPHILPTAILRLRPEQADALLTADFVAPGNPAFEAVLWALRNCQNAFPSKLSSMMSAIRTADHPTSGRQFEHALIVLARTAPQVAEALLPEALQGDNKHWHSGAVQAMTILAGVHHAPKVVYGKLSEGGFDRLTAPQRNWLLANEYCNQVANGGHDQFFVNPSRERADITPEALEAVGATLSASLLRQALTLRADRDAGRLSEQEFENALHPLDKTFFDSGCDGVDTRLQRYAIAHPAHFSNRTHDAPPAARKNRKIGHTRPKA